MFRSPTTPFFNVLAALSAVVLLLGGARPTAHAAAPPARPHRPGLAADAVLTGQVTRSGVGLSDVMITASAVGGAPWVQSTTTITNGFYLLNTPAGTFDVSASRFGYRFSGPFRFTSALTTTPVVINFTATLLPLYTVTGTVKAAGNGVPGVPVDVFYTAALVTHTLTAADGSYAVRVPAGTYTLTAQTPGYTIDNPISTTVTTTDVRSVNFLATQLFYTVTGNVKLDGVGLAGVTIGAQLTSTQSFSATSASDGTYALRLPIGTYTLTATSPGYALSEALTATVTSADLTGKNFTATRLFYTVSGVVTSGGTVLPGVQLSCDTTSAVTGSAGAYTLSGLRYGACVLAPALAGYTFSPPFVPLNVTGNIDEQNFVATPIPLFTIGGRILDAQSGEAVAGVQVTDGARTTFTDFGGFYVLAGVPAGTYTISAAKSGYRLSDATAVVIGNANIDAINFSATKNVTVHDVSGEVRPFSSGIASQCVAGVQLAYGIGSAVTPSDGKFTLLGLPPGTYALTPIKPGCLYTPATQIVTVTNTSVANVLFTESQIPASLYSISGRATTPAGAGLGGTRIAYGAGVVLADANGYFAIPNLPAARYTLTPTLPGYRFDPATTVITISTSNVVIVNMQGRAYSSRIVLPFVMQNVPVIVCNIPGADCGVEPDNAVRAGATPLPTNSTIYYALIGSTADVRDVYGFALIAGVRYRFALTHQAVGDINLYLYDEKGATPLLSSAQPGTVNEAITFTPTVSGRYFLQVVAASVRVKSTYQIALAY
jgi:hypothetical protein